MNISDDERELFRSEMSDVKPLHPENEIKNTEPLVEPASEEIEIKIPRSIKILPKPVSKDSRQIHKPIKIVAGDDKISFHKPGLQHKLLTQFKKGKMPIEATLDLHAFTSQEALDKTTDFLSRCTQNKKRVICIIHGKGKNSQQEPIIKNLLNAYLRGHESVLAFHSAKQWHGGTGALYVLLKTN